MRVLEKYFAQGLEEVPCNLCGGLETETIATKERFGTNTTTVICAQCGLIYINPRWTAESYSRFYEADYRDLIPMYLSPREFMLRQRVHGSQILDFCHAFLHQGSSVLDVGCAAGGVLSAFQLAGDFAVSGIEPSLEHSHYARETLGIDVKTGMFGAVPIPEASCDLVILTQTLNHLLDPAGTMAEIHSLLKPDGLFFVEVQNFPEYARRCAPGKAIQVDHTYYFCPETLECMARRIGLEPIKVSVDTAETAGHYHGYMKHRVARNHIRMLLRKAEPELDLPFPNYQLIRDEVLAVLERHKKQPKSKSESKRLIRRFLRKAG